MRHKNVSKKVEENVPKVVELKKNENKIAKENIQNIDFISKMKSCKITVWSMPPKLWTPSGLHPFQATVLGPCCP